MGARLWASVVGLLTFPPDRLNTNNMVWIHVAGCTYLLHAKGKDLNTLSRGYKFFFLFFPHKKRLKVLQVYLSLNCGDLQISLTFLFAQHLQVVSFCADPSRPSSLSSDDLDTPARSWNMTLLTTMFRGMNDKHD